MNIFKPQTENKVGKAIFYIFEISAIVIAFLYLVLTIYYTANLGSFIVFVTYLLQTVFNTLVVYGIGKIIDLHYCKNSCNTQEKPEEKKEDA